MSFCKYKSLFFSSMNLHSRWFYCSTVLYCSVQALEILKCQSEYFCKQERRLLWNKEAYKGIFSIPLWQWRRESINLWNSKILAQINGLSFDGRGKNKATVVRRKDQDSLENKWYLLCIYWETVKHLTICNMFFIIYLHGNMIDAHLPSKISRWQCD